MKGISTKKECLGKQSEGFLLDLTGPKRITALELFESRMGAELILNGLTERVDQYRIPSYRTSHDTITACGASALPLFPCTPNWIV